jgi:hypothetical protein
MARARNIKPGIFTNEDLAELPIEARFLFVGLWTMADREGRLEDRPKRIKMTIFPADTIDVEPLLEGLHRMGLLIRYEVEGSAYIWIPGFTKHQKPHPREVASAIPPYLGTTQAAPRCDQGNAKEVASPAESLLSESPLSECSSLQKKARERAAFVKPTVEQVSEYVRNRGSPIDPEAFVAHYESNGWKVGGKAPMKNWKAAIVTWEKRESEKRNGTHGKPVFEQPHERRARQLDEALARAEGAAGVEEDAGDLRGQVLEGVWSRAE